MPNLFGDLSEEELYQQSLDFGDMEYEAEVARAMGPFGEGEIDADRQISILYPDDWESGDQGLYVKQWGRDEWAAEKAASPDGEIPPEVSEFIEEKYGYLLAGTADYDIAKAQMEEGFTSVEPSIFTFGASGTNPDVQGHEFRHMALDAFRNMPDSEMEGQSKRAKALKYIKGHIPREGMPEEIWNRQFDSYRKESDIAGLYGMYKEAARIADDPEDTEKIIGKISRVLKQRGEKFSKLEAAAQEYEGHEAPEGTTWQEFYFKQFERRHAKAMREFRARFEI